MSPSSSSLERGSVFMRISNRGKKHNSILRSLLAPSRHKVQEIRNQIKVGRECKTERYPLLHQLLACQRKQQKWGLELATCTLAQDYLFPAFSPLKSCHVRRNIPFIIYGDSHSCLLCSCYYAPCQVQALFFLRRSFSLYEGGEKKRKKEKNNCLQD